MAGRRRINDRLLLIANILAANAVAAIWIMAFVQPDVLGLADAGAAAEGVGRRLVVPLATTAAWAALLLAVGLLMWNFAFLVRRRDERIPDNWVISHAPGGSVRVAREAVEAALRAAGEQVAPVTRLRVSLQRGAPKRVRVVGQFHCAEGHDHMTCGARLREHLQRRFEDLVRLPDGQLLEVELEFQGFSGKLAEGVAAPSEAVEPEPFRGPQYPVDDEGVDRQ
ncbi:MAG: hypothetical protein VYA51_05185 [Planctomycetota bacterium]|nr:hypothetical protein [Planctomycetota bacterium]